MILRLPLWSFTLSAIKSISKLSLPNSVELAWCLSAMSLTIFSILFASEGPQYQGGPFYIALNLIFLLFVFFYLRKKRENFQLGGFYFILGCLCLFLTDPLFENDHFRYLWEGQAWINGINPYRVAAKDVGDVISAPLREKVAFNHLTSVYPLVAQLYFSLFAVFPWKMGLLLMQLTNAVMVFSLFQMLKNRGKSQYLAYCFMFFQKEFIQSVHIDLLAIWMLLFFILKKKPWLGIWTSFQVKIIPLCLLPFLFFQRKEWMFQNKGKSFIWLLGTITLTSLIYFSILGGFENLTGVFSFGRDWIWNPGFFGWLNRLFPQFSHEMRVVTFLCWILSWLILQLKVKNDIWVLAFYTYSSMMFFSPVYNSWYAIWILVPAMMTNLKWGVAYGCMSFWAYLYYGGADFVWFSELCSHCLIFPAIWESLRKTQRKTQSVELQEEPPSTQNFAQKT